MRWMGEGAGISSGFQEREALGSIRLGAGGEVHHKALKQSNALQEEAFGVDQWIIPTSIHVNGQKSYNSDENPSTGSFRYQKL